MAAGHDAGIECVRHGLQVVIHALLAGHLHLLEDVIVAAGHQYARLADAQVLHQLEVLPGGADPGGDLREPIAQVHALLDGLTVLFAVDEELRLANDAVGAAKTGHQLVQIHDLLHRIGLDGLLPVAEGGIRDPDVLRHAHGHAPVVEGDAGNLIIGVDVPIQVRVRHILQRILVLALLQQIGFRGHFQHRFSSPVGSIRPKAFCIIVYKDSSIVKYGNTILTKPLAFGSGDGLFCWTTRPALCII